MRKKSTDEARCQELIDRLSLTYLDEESGLISVEYVSSVSVLAEDGASPASNAIYYLLNHEYPQNHLHWLFSDDHHILIEGGPADYFIFTADGRSHRYTLGRHHSAGQQLMVSAPAGSYKAVRLHPDADYLLVGSIVTPAWSPERVRYGLTEDFLDRYVGSSPWADAAFLKSLGH